jgi:hypothetical protein
MCFQRSKKCEKQWEPGRRVKDNLREDTISCASGARKPNCRKARRVQCLSDLAFRHRFGGCSSANRLLAATRLRPGRGETLSQEPINELIQFADSERFRRALARELEVASAAKIQGG